MDRYDEERYCARCRTSHAVGPGMCELMDEMFKAENKADEAMGDGYFKCRVLQVGPGMCELHEAEKRESIKDKSTIDWYSMDEDATDALELFESEKNNM